ncbi:MAG: AlpA family phage regulatory protein [Burkholderiales bacterium]
MPRARCHRGTSNFLGGSLMHQDVLRLPAVKQTTGDSRSAVYKNMSERVFPRPIRLGRRCVGWVSSEVQAVNRARIAGWDADRIRALVLRLEASRASLDPDAVHAGDA